MMERGYLVSGRYEILDTLGEGGMANVYLAEDTILHRQVAVKVLRMDLQHDQATIRRFQREAKATSELSHPNIVGVYDVGTDNGMQYIVMEYVAGDNLKTFIDQHYPLPLPEVIEMMTQVLSAVQLAHSQGIIHRDLKPQNILVTASGQVKIADFGIAVALNDKSVTQTNSLLGSVHYISPEQARGGMATPQSDIYALGIILYELLMGKVPFSGDSAVTIALKHFHDEIPSLRQFNHQIPQALENVVLRATAKDPEQRYQSAAAMAADLQTSLDPERANEPRFVPVVADSNLAETKVLSDLPNEVRESELASPDQAATATNTEPDPVAPNVKRRLPKWSWWLIGGAGAVILIVALVLLLGKKDVTVPDLSGMSVNEAKLTLQDKNLKIGQTDYEHSNQVAKDLVIRSDPSVKTSVKSGSTVNLVLSSGAKTYTIGDYRDQDYDTVKSKLQRAGFTVKRKNKNSETVAAGQIISQSVKAKKKVVPKQTTITLTVSQGPALVSLRDLSMYTKQEAQEYAENVGLKVTFGTSEYSADFASGTVMSQNPAAGTSVASGSTITLVLSKGAEPASSSSAADSSSENQQTEETTTFDKTITIEPATASNDSESASGSSTTAGSTFLIYIGDAKNSLSTVYKKIENVTATQKLTLSFEVKDDNSATYRIVRDGVDYANETIKP
ncbi:Stk1 family PASTA domain-containing Ser/Thr kinase [Lapidilactobacillus wuchangensis]|uniref:Stk1 family PASTA domain-containing Ser/Thr kinase n=1 Tax=Lapidilactobacillus wuchangensis TaxID=2486001 RepID=UPI000F784B52|nr:Stk1 family PASTA domain-containing Ser/Thr kinase [Lapidilactobacillus wuchangensis]